MEPRPRTRGIAGLLALTLVTAGCATLFDRDEPRLDVDGDEVLVRIINDNFYDVTAYANWDGHRERIGRVVGNRTETFRIHTRPGSNLAITVVVQAGGTHTTDPITVWPGEEVEVRVPPDLDRR